MFVHFLHSIHDFQAVDDGDVERSLSFDMPYGWVLQKNSGAMTQRASSAAMISKSLREAESPLAVSRRYRASRSYTTHSFVTSALTCLIAGGSLSRSLSHVDARKSRSSCSSAVTFRPEGPFCTEPGTQDGRGTA
jgi:hypothetical protein